MHAILSVGSSTLDGIGSQIHNSVLPHVHIAQSAALVPCVLQHELVFCGTAITFNDHLAGRDMWAIKPLGNSVKSSLQKTVVSEIPMALVLYVCA